tara:strand:- start:260 stop:472 length:213 start_codon:yes stop_codon:yes gene_type:complete
MVIVEVIQYLARLHLLEEVAEQLGRLHNTLPSQVVQVVEVINLVVHLQKVVKLEVQEIHLLSLHLKEIQE